PGALRATVAGAGRIMDLDEFLAVTVTTALVVVVDGVLAYERYFHGIRTGDRLLGFSATKSALALLVGQAVDDGRLPGLDTPVTGLVPELGSSGYAGVSLRQLLTMTSGVGWREDYHNPESPASRMMRRWRAGAGAHRHAADRRQVAGPAGSQPLLGPGEQPARAGVPRPGQAAQHDHYPRRFRVPLVAAGPGR